MPLKIIYHLFSFKLDNAQTPNFIDYMSININNNINDIKNLFFS